MQFKLNQIITKIKDLQKTRKGQVTLLLILVLLFCSVFTISIGIKNLGGNISNKSDFIDFLKSPVRIIDNETLDVSKWKTYKNDKEGIEFKYPAEYSIREERDSDWYLFPGMDHVVEFSVPESEKWWRNFLVGWNRYQSLDEDYQYNCGDEGGEYCGGSTIGEDIKKINNESNLSVSGFQALYSTSTAHGSTSDETMDINYPQVIVRIYGSLHVFSRFSVDGKQLSQLSSDRFEIMKTVAGTIKVSN